MPDSTDTVITCQLGHYTYASDHQNFGNRQQWQEHYQVINDFSLQVPRKGKTRTAIRCSICGEELTLDVLSSRRAKLNMFFLLFIAGLVSAIVVPPIGAIILLASLFSAVITPEASNMVALKSVNKSTHRHALLNIVKIAPALTDMGPAAPGRLRPMLRRITKFALGGFAGSLVVLGIAVLVRTKIMGLSRQSPDFQPTLVLSILTWLPIGAFAARRSVRFTLFLWLAAIVLIVLINLLVPPEM